MRNLLDDQLEQLNRAMIVMGSLCEQSIAQSVKALEENDITYAKRVVDISEQIDHKERDIEGMCLRLLLQQQPVARDLRLISAALKMITDMERIGDQSADIAEIVTTAQLPINENYGNVPEMAEAVIWMVTKSIDAFVRKDTEIAQQVIRYDDVVDRCFNEMKNTLIQYLVKEEKEAEYVLDLLMIAKYFERIGDHAVNIAKWVLFSITGTHEGE